MKFISKYKSYNIILRPAFHRTNNIGMNEYVQGVSAQFENSEYNTDDEEMIKALKSSKFYGTDFWSDEPEEKVKPTEEAEKAEADKKLGAELSSPEKTNKTNKAGKTNK